MIFRRKKSTDPAPVTRIELDESRLRHRALLTVILIAVAAAAFGYSIWQWRQVDPGWTEIEAAKTGAETVSPELKFLYELEEGTSTSTYRALGPAYTEACAYAYKVFDPSKSYSSEGIHGLGLLNQHPNEEVTVDAALYRALELLKSRDNRLLFLGPVYEVYDSLFRSVTDAEAAEVDPFQNAGMGEFCREAAGYARDPAMVDLELLGDGRVCLQVAEEYAAFARENGVVAFLDLYWMRNAFVVDSIAEDLIARGFTRGSLTSRDGFARCMDASGNVYTSPIFTREEDTVRQTGTFEYDQPAAIVSLHDYPLTGSFTDRFYEFSDGSIRTPYVDPADGLCRTRAHDLFVHSYDRGCAELLLENQEKFLAGW